MRGATFEFASQRTRQTTAIAAHEAIRISGIASLLWGTGSLTAWLDRNLYAEMGFNIFITQQQQPKRINHA